MGAIVVSGVSGLFEYEQAVHLFKVGCSVAGLILALSRRCRFVQTCCNINR
jgi:hypothetical protein